MCILSIHFFQGNPIKLNFTISIGFSNVLGRAQRITGGNVTLKRSTNALSCSAAEGWKSCYDRRRPLNPGGGLCNCTDDEMRVMKKNVCGSRPVCYLSQYYEMVPMTYKDVAGKIR